MSKKSGDDYYCCKCDYRTLLQSNEGTLKFSTGLAVKGRSRRNRVVEARRIIDECEGVEIAHSSKVWKKIVASTKKIICEF